MGSGQGEAVASAAGASWACDLAAAVTAVELTIRLLPRSSLSSHLRGISLLSFFK